MIDIEHKTLKYLENNLDHLEALKDKTKIGYDLNKIANHSTLKGIFAKEMRNKLEEGNIEKELLEKAIEIGMQALS